jgi:hypothetical protein
MIVNNGFILYFIFIKTYFNFIFYIILYHIKYFQFKYNQIKLNNMLCPYCESNNIRHLKVYISMPKGAKKNLCLQCKRTFIIHTKQTNNNII